MRAALFLILATAAGLIPGSAAEPPRPLRALLVTGGCCHDYGRQKDILKQGLEERLHVEVIQVHSTDTSTRARFEMYEKPDWAQGYDVVIHDECSADVKDLPYVQNILSAHKAGVGAVNLHCAMHCYRTGTDDWFQFVGLQSTGHGPQEPITIRFLDATHPVTRGMEDWTTIKEELYNNVKVFPASQPLARGRQVVKRRDGTEKVEDAVVAWVTEYGQGKVFSTTLGHNSATVADARYLDLVARGLLWTCGKLGADGKPLAGYAARPAQQK
ncbi:MAG TPA: ThuA domain-containing protein [Methylomirabilota bacterium]|nr:ThuA domain-containing protein [Methylomirabilota bacterium]